MKRNLLVILLLLFFTVTLITGAVDPTIGLSLLIPGGVFLIGGIICAALYPSYKRKSDTYKKQLEEMMNKSALFKNERVVVQIPQPVIIPSKTGDYYGLSLRVLFM